MIHLDGAEVSYCGATGDGVTQGDLGRVLIADETSAHVLWTTGAAATRVTLVDQHDLVEAEAPPLTASQTIQHHLDQSLEYEVVESVLDRIDAGGGLDRLSMFSEEVIEWVAARLRPLGGFRRELASLDVAEADSVVRAATRRVLQDAIETLEGEDD